ncbi:ATPase [Candidatus Bipolaricaulota bacterium]|nr:ATPase [Candidatus Bipolaricaulota bacterium]
MRYVLGLDAGGTKTLALVADEEGHVLGVGRGGPANHQVVGLKPALAEIGRACRSALGEAGLSPPVDLAVFGLAGADLPMDFELLAPAVRKLGFAKGVRVENDAMIALRAGTRRGWGVVVVCGTGFNAAGLSPDGRGFRLPGLGWISGDWGGGMDLAREAVRAVARAWDGRGRPTLLSELLLSALGLPSAEELISALYMGQLGRPGGLPEERLLELVPLVFEAAAQGDEVAQGLLVRLGEEAGRAAAAVIRHLGLEKTDVEVILAGGLLRGKSPLLFDTAVQTIHRTAPKALVKRLEVEPVVGAALLALEELKELNQRTRERLLSTLPPELRSEPV